MSCFYMGTRNRMLEVRAPSVNMPSSKQGYFNKVDFLNGGTSVRRSTAAHKNYTMTWNSMDRDEARKILDLADGVRDGPQSRIFPQAHNRLHSARGLLSFLMDGRR